MLTSIASFSLLAVLLLPILGLAALPTSLEQVQKNRLTKELPKRLKEKNLDCWLVFTREGATDPLLPQLGAAHMVARAALVFGFDPQGNFHRRALAASYDVTPLIQSGIYEEVIGYREEGILPHLKTLFAELQPQRIAINRSRDIPMADGLTAGMLGYLEEALPEYKDRFVPAEGLIVSLFSRRAPAEIAALRKAVEGTQAILKEAFTGGIIIPGKTTELDVADFLRVRAEALNLTESCMSIVAGPSRGHSEPSDRIIRLGDLVRADICFRYQGYSSDIQRTAYVLKKGETEAPDFVQELWAVTLGANRAALAAMKPGVPARAVDTAGRGYLTERGYPDYPHGSGHPIGPQVHDIGPLPGPDWPERYGSITTYPLEAGMVLAIEPALYINEPRLGGDVNVGLEEDVLVTEEGYEILGTPQEELWLIK